MNVEFAFTLREDTAEEGFTINGFKVFISIPVIPAKVFDLSTPASIWVLLREN
jgi:hypothetical protein